MNTRLSNFDKSPARWLALCLLALCVYSCANIARPTGGPKDETPPVYISSTPTNNELNFNKNKIEILFDEIILVENATEKVVVSPPQKQMHTVRTSGKKVFVEFKDSLLANTTYTVDFSDAIVDNNEKNPLSNFSLAFSTGEVLDTMRIGGVLLNAENLEPITGMLVGIHSNLDDTAFTKTPLLRIAVTDAYGRFSIKNVAPGSYRLYALKDANRDFMFDNPTEDIAFFDSIVIPSVELEMHTDTIWTKATPNDSAVIDTIVSGMAPHYYPNDILLRSFNENYKAQYLESNTRTRRRLLQMTFATKSDSLPTLTPLNFEAEEWAILEKSATNDTLKYWIKDSLIYLQDTLVFEANYLRSDSLSQLASYTDTLRFIYRQPRNTGRTQKSSGGSSGFGRGLLGLGNKEEEEDSVPPITYLDVKLSLAATIDIFAKPTITFEYPMLDVTPDKIILEEKVDTLWQPISREVTLRPDTNNIRLYEVSAKWVPGGTYRMRIDSATVNSVYGLFNNHIQQEFKVRTEEEYANLYMNIVGINEPAFVELITKDDKVVRTGTVKEGGVLFSYLAPGTYYARLVIDNNENGVFDTGNYTKKIQPEMVYYNPNEFVLKANWDVEQSWNVLELPLDKQKPRLITKNKPKDEKVEPKKEEEEEFISPFYTPL